MTAKRVFYEGRVQGIGFRYTVRHLAKGYDVIGWVRNLADGRVELLAAGQSGEIDGFLAAIGESELAAFIKKQQIQPATEAEVIGLSGFVIRP